MWDDVIPMNLEACIFQVYNSDEQLDTAGSNLELSGFKKCCHMLPRSQDIRAAKDGKETQVSADSVSASETAETTEYRRPMRL